MLKEGDCNYAEHIPNMKGRVSGTYQLYLLIHIQFLLINQQYRRSFHRERLVEIIRFTLKIIY